MHKVSFFEHLAKPPVEKDLLLILEEIKSGVYQIDINLIRSLIEKGLFEKANLYKRNLPAFTPSGIFLRNRKREALTDYNSLIVIDIDKIKDVNILELKQRIESNEYVFACFISPSGYGLKILVKTDASLESHEMAFDQLKIYFESVFNIVIDKSGKDVTRLCFVSFDENIYINTESEIFIVQVKGNTDLLQQVAGIELIYNACKKFTQNKIRFSEGNRNNFVYLLACNCNRSGVPYDLCTQFILNDFKYSETEVSASIKSAYSHKPEHGSVEALKGTAKRIKATMEFLSKRYKFRLNKITNTLEISLIEKNEFKEIADIDENNLFLELNTAGINCNINLLRSIINSNFTSAFNPFEDYFYNLDDYDGETDYIDQLAETVITTNQEFWRFAFKKWLVAAVKCLLFDEEVNHTVIVFSGAQGVGKTTWLLNLIPNSLSKYKYSGTITVSNKDTLVHLSECFLINLDELENLNKSEIGELKELITKGTLRQRLPYGRNNTVLVRRASFVGSVNSGHFLSDTTGNRRFLCFEVLKIDNKHSIDMSKVFSQALHLISQGFKHWFDEEEIPLLTKNNSRFTMPQLEEELLLTYFKIPEIGDDIICRTTTEILHTLAEKSKIQVNNSVLNLLGKQLKKHGFKQVTFNNRKTYEVTLINI